ncbi:hypothetical protein MMC16_005632 [Acarospora aff. strigata]|nr:hypothetical protein [Acarospora aff. strigata]
MYHHPSQIVPGRETNTSTRLHADGDFAAVLDEVLREIVPVGRVADGEGVVGIVSVIVIDEEIYALG